MSAAITTTTEPTVAELMLKSQNSSGSFSPDGIADAIAEFNYNPVEVISSAFSRRYGEILKEGSKIWTDIKKV